jgi:hypothetical protein
VLRDMRVVLTTQLLEQYSAVHLCRGHRVTLLTLRNTTQDDPRGKPSLRVDVVGYQHLLAEALAALKVPRSRWTTWAAAAVTLTLVAGYWCWWVSTAKPSVCINK